MSATAERPGRAVVVTGANTGVGRATAEALAARGARLVLACRSRARAEAALAALHALPSAPPPSLVELDLADLTSVREGAAAIREAAPRIDVLVNNAGVGGTRGITRDGFELAFGVNHLGHYLLTRLLWSSLAPDGRVIHVTSGSHARAPGVDEARLRGRTRSLTGLPEYATSKLCQLLFHHELTRRSRGPLSLAADPGDVASDGWRHVPWPIRPLLTCRMKPPSEGARTSVHCASAPDVRAGAHYVDARPAPCAPIARDPALARSVWERSADWVGLDRGGP